MSLGKGTIDACGIKAHFIDEDAFLVFGDGTILKNGAPLIRLENGALDSVILDAFIYVLGDNGKIVKLSKDGEVQLLATPKFGFADTLISNQQRGIFCVNSSRKVFVFNADLSINLEFSPPKSPLCAAFDASGNNLAIGHGNGVSIYDLNGNEAPLELKTEGGVIGASFSPDTAFLVAATGVPSLVGWRLFDGVGFRMAGYPSKAASFCWINNMPLLVTSGGPVGVIWPFFGMDGPMGKNAETIRTRLGVVSAVATSANKIALGYGDGGIDLADYETKKHKHIMGARPRNDINIDLRKGTSRIVSIAFTKTTTKCAYVAEDGKWGIVRVSPH